MKDSVIDVTVLGAGVMGAGIAQCLAQAGYRVALYTRTLRRLDESYRQIRDSLGRLAERDPELDVDSTIDHITFTNQLEAHAASVVIESIAEDLQQKKALYSRLFDIRPEIELIGSNTSGIPVTLLAEGLPDSSVLVGTHFFCPVPMMNLCELVLGRETSPSALGRARSLVETMGKKPIVVHSDTPGFVTTRLLSALVVDAIRIVESGLCTASEVDLACQLAFGHKMGPLATADLSGLDVLFDVLSTLHAATNDARYAPPPLLQQLCRDGHLGRKSGRGFMEYA